MRRLCIWQKNWGSRFPDNKPAGTQLLCWNSRNPASGRKRYGLVWSSFLPAPTNDIEGRKRPWWWIATQQSRNQTLLLSPWAASKAKPASLLPEHPFLTDPKRKLSYSTLSFTSSSVSMGMHHLRHGDSSICVPAAFYTWEGSLILKTPGTPLHAETSLITHPSTHSYTVCESFLHTVS